MKNLYFFILIVLFPAQLFSQSTSATATTIVPVAYFDATPGVPSLSNYNLVSSSAQTFFSCPGNQDVYWLKFNIPVPSSTLNSTRSVKITVNSSAFTPTIDFFDSAVTWKECATGTILRTSPVTNPVIPGQDYYIRISGTDGTAGEAFSIGVETYPTSEISAGYYPAADADGYTLCQNFRRALVANTGTTLVQATRYRLVPTSTPNNGSCSIVVNGTTSLTNTSAYSCLCYGITYDAYVEVQVDGHWCGESTVRPMLMQTGPTTSITTPTSNVPFLNSIDCTSACSNNVQYQWEFTASNGVPVYATSSGGVVLSTGIGLRFNRIYQVRVRVIQNSTACPVTGPWCGVNGPNGTPFILYTEPLPTITIPSIYCNTVLSPGASINIPFFPSVEQYWWQFVKVNPTSPYNPIGIPTVVNTSFSLVSISQGLANLAGNTYRMCVKPAVISFNNPQQGSWGPYCYYAIAPASAPSVGMIQQNGPTEEVLFESEEAIDTDETSAGTVITMGTQRILIIDMGEQTMAQTGHIQIFDLQGKLVYQDIIPYASGVNMIQRELPTRMTNGIYIYKVFSDSESIIGKFSVSSN